MNDSKRDPNVRSLEMYFEAQQRLRHAESLLAADPDNPTLARLVDVERGNAEWHKARAHAAYPDAFGPPPKPRGAA